MQGEGKWLLLVEELCERRLLLVVGKLGVFGDGEFVSSVLVPPPYVILSCCCLEGGTYCMLSEELRAVERTGQVLL